jgi:hypothetical protein
VLGQAERKPAITVSAKVRRLVAANVCHHQNKRTIVSQRQRDHSCG